ncbi:high-affinity iron transporter [Thermanaeromonas toyohensis ToBE]|uniref:High-affinity iron transporter n=1 Tax=Thermanaeromonas toyohensis ToBE TaxID=698762 RepID=A0A1W1VXW3_9FIRM|nr:FTR1 family protein [Thermanaeromonas toyohensis]SMB98195.1 high-affinity iron transporter [Thermanaeromonas toyohensis ToBE]
MLAGMLITIREGLEAFLIVGILLGYLKKIGQERFAKHIWLGFFAALTSSVTLAWVFQLLAVQFEGTSALVFEMVISLVAVGVLTYMVLWMQQQSLTIKSDLENQVNAALSANNVLALAGLAFVSVLREGLETALFLTALAGSSETGSLLPGALLGLAVAALVAFAFFRAAVRLNLRKFFLVTGFLLIFIAAGLVGHAILASHELGLVPPIISEVWNTNGIIDEEGLLGRVLHAFIGYDGNPSLMWVLGYFGYVLVFGRKFLQQIGRARSAPTSSQR